MKLYIIFFLTFINCKALIFHEYFLDLFKVESVETEYTAYKLLKKEPIKKDINYLVIPWTPLINQKKLDIVPKIKLNGGFTICQHIHYERIIPILKNIGINVLFTPHVIKKYDGITVLPFPHFAANGIAPSTIKNIFYSFIGIRWSHWTRKDIFNMSHPKNTVIIERKDWHFFKKDKVSQEKEKHEYQDVISRSIFSLCPRGTGASTIRFWESLKAGAIPVLIADEMMLPAGVNWKNCVIRVKETNVKNIPKILNSVSKEKQNAMIKSCINTYNLFSGKNLVRNIREYYMA